MTKTLEKHIKSLMADDRSAAWLLPDGRAIITDGPRILLLPEGTELPEGVKATDIPKAYEKTTMKLLAAENEGPDFCAVDLPSLQEMKEGIQKASDGKRSRRVTWSQDCGFFVNARMLKNAMESLGCRRMYVPKGEISKWPAILYAKDDLVSGMKEFLFAVNRKIPESGFQPVD